MLKQFKNDVPLKALFALTLIIYILIDSRISLPYYMLLRWVFPAVMLLCAAGKYGAIKLIPNELYLIVVVYFGITVFNSPVRAYSMERWASLLLIVGMYTTYYSYLSSVGRLDEVIKIYGFVYFLYGLMNILYIRNYDGDRLVGFTASANSLGLEANISLAFAMYFYKKNINTGKGLWRFYIFAMVLLIVSSGSRTAFASLCIALAFFTITIEGNRAIVFLPVVLFIFTFILPKSILMSIPGLSRLINLGTSRDELWDYGLFVYRQKPWFGWGYGAANTTTSIAVAEGLGYHSSFITLLVETGRIGLVLVLILLFITGINGLNYWRKTRSLEVAVMLLIYVEFLLCFYAESAMTSVGSTEGFMFWGVLIWIILKTREKYIYEQ